MADAHELAHVQRNVVLEAIEVAAKLRRRA
jgi:hypothetical protein